MKLKFEQVKLCETNYYEIKNNNVFIAEDIELTPDTICYVNDENRILFFQLPTKIFKHRYVDGDYHYLMYFNTKPILLMENNYKVTYQMTQEVSELGISLVEHVILTAFYSIFSREYSINPLCQPMNKDRNNEYIKFKAINKFYYRKLIISIWSEISYKYPKMIAFFKSPLLYFFIFITIVQDVVLAAFYTLFLFVFFFVLYRVNNTTPIARWGLGLGKKYTLYGEIAKKALLTMKSLPPQVINEKVVIKVSKGIEDSGFNICLMNLSSTTISKIDFYKRELLKSVGLVNLSFYGVGECFFHSVDESKKNLDGKITVEEIKQQDEIILIENFKSYFKPQPTTFQIEVQKKYWGSKPKKIWIFVDVET